MSQIGTSWKLTSWSIPAWAANSWFGPQPVPVGNPINANTVSRLGALFKKTTYGMRAGQGTNEAPIAVRKFLDELKVSRKKSLTDERRKLASLKQEVRKADASVRSNARSDMAEVPPGGRMGDASATATEALSQTIRELEARVAEQSAIVRAKRKELAEAEQARVDALSEYALEEWNREEEARKAEDDEMRQILLLVHEL